METTKQKLEQIKVDFYKAIEGSDQRIVIGDLADSKNHLEVRINNILVGLTDLIDELPEEKRFYMKREFPNSYFSLIDMNTGISIMGSRWGVKFHDLESYCTMLNDGFSKQLQT